MTYNVTALTVTLFVQCIERLASELGMASDTGETLHMEHLLHSNTATPITEHVVSTSGTPAWERYKAEHWHKFQYYTLNSIKQTADLLFIRA